jgi:anti-sigma factor RsiW
MSCKRARKLFGRTWDDEVTQAEREWLEGHFTTCSACRAEYEGLARTMELVSSLPREESPADFVERTVARARRAATEPDRVPGISHRWIPITAAAALLAVLGGSAIQWAGLSTAPEQRSTSQAAAIQQPTWVGPAPGTTPAPSNADTDEQLVAGGATVPDSVFNHGDDVEFILDPVTLRKGRAHTTIRGTDAPRGQQATITF